jgi:hypothetical protein
LLTWALDEAAEPATEWLCDQLDLYWEVIAPRLAAPPLVDGTTLMAVLGLAAGPALGRLLAALRTAQVRGDITTPAEALALARTLVGQR